MIEINSLADLFRFADGLLEAAARSPEIRDAIEVERQGLETSLGETKILKGRQEELTALRQETTQQLKASVTRTKEAAMRFQAIVKAKLGPRSERLVQFNVAPLRSRPRKPVVVKPLGGEEVGTRPEAVSVEPVV